jgi:hypothetical protein
MGLGCLTPRQTGWLNVGSIARVFRRDSPPTRSRRSTGSGRESSSMLTSVEGKAVQGFSGFYNWTWDVCSLWKQTNDWSQHPSTFTNGPGQPLRRFSWTVTSKYPSCNIIWLWLHTSNPEFWYGSAKNCSWWSIMGSPVLAATWLSKPAGVW